MLQNSRSLTRLLGELKKLPGVGEKTALRLAFHLLKHPPLMASLAESLQDAQGRVRFCSTCFGITEDDPCGICTGGRDRSVICVVEEPQDLLAVERSQAYRGLYHVLQGALSPLSGISPSDLRITELMGRLAEGGVREVLLATNFSVEGEATALYLLRVLKDYGIRITRLAMGLPVGSDLDFADQVTIRKALEGRTELKD